MKSGCEKGVATTQRSIKLPVINNSGNRTATKPHSTVSKWRAAALILLNLLMAAHIIQWRLQGSTISPIEPSESMWTLQRGEINAGFIFFTLAITLTVIFGRFVCGWACHIVALQDLCSWLLIKMGLRPRAFRSRLLAYIPLIVAVYMFVWPTLVRAFVKAPDQRLIPQFTDHIVTTDFWATFAPVAVAIPFLFICGFMVVYFFGNKGFCTYVCPYGAFFGIADRFAPGKIRVTDQCNECGHCTAVCTSNVTIHSEVKQYGMVVDTGCMKCMDCVSACPNDALYLGFGKPSIAIKTTGKKTYTLSWTEEILGIIVFALSYFAVWDVYQLVPMLMALGIACVTTYLILRLYRMTRVSDLSFYRYILKKNGKLTFAGIVFVSLSMIWIGLNAHSGWVRYHERGGALAFQSLQVPDELALASADPGEWLSKSESENVASGQIHFRDSVDLGLFENTPALSKYAWLEFLGGNSDHALDLLKRSAERQSGESRAIALYYRGAILNRLGRSDEALTDLVNALKERPDLAVALEEKGESLWRLGRRDDANAAWIDALRINKNLPVANSFLAASLSSSEPERAAVYRSTANDLTPNDPYFEWMLGLRLKNLGMNEQAGPHFAKAIKMNSAFALRKIPK